MKQSSANRMYFSKLKSTSLKFVFAIFAVLSFSAPAKAQFDIALGAGTVGNTSTGYPCPLQDYWEGHRGQYLYTASELNRIGMTAGTITAIRFQVTTLNNFSGLVEALNIKIGTTTATSLTAWITNATPVYGPADYVPVVGLNSFTFSTPFVWNGTDNIVIDVCNGDSRSVGATTWTGNPTVTWTTGLGFNASQSRFGDDNGSNFCTNPPAVAASTSRPNIIFAWIPSNSCGSTPAPGNTSSTVTSVCPATPFVLSLPSVAPAGGLDLQWESAPSNSGPWNPISGATAATYIATQNATTWYRCQVTCSAAGDAPQWSTPVQVTIKPFFDCYCTPVSSSGNCQFLDVITNVTFQGINRSSTCTGGYSNYINTDTARAMANSTYPISVGVGSGGAFQHVGVWIDFNRNGSFDTDEFTYVGYANGGTISSNITLPAGALTGFTRMRVRVKYLFGSGTPAPGIFDTEPCNTFTFGETEDYTINILPFVTCSGFPNGGSAISTSTVVCGGNNFTLALRNQTLAAGITYQWQSSPNNTAWNNIAGATNQTFTTNTNGDTYYRCAVICGANTSYSSSVLVTVASCINMPATGSTSTCNALFYDSGGPNGDYTGSEYRVYTIFPSIPVGKVKAVFTQFSTENTWDGFRIYNGSDTFAPMFNSGLPQGRMPWAPANSYYGSTSPGTITSTALNGALTFVFRSDPSINAPGWAAIISCELPPPCTNAGNPGSTLVNGVANITSTNVCVGSGVRLSVQNPQNFLGIRYQWQISSDGTNYANTSVADTNLTFIPDISATRWYRCQVSCSTAPGSTANTIPVRIILDSTCINMPQSGSWTIDCNGPAATFYDDGGSGNNYSNGQNRTFTIKPNIPGKRLSVVFSAWNVEAGYDFLTIYDGNSTIAPQIGRYSVSSPLFVTSTAADGSLTFVFTSDNAVSQAGWAAALSCEIPPDCITAPTPFDPGLTLATNTSVCAGSTSTLTVQYSNYSNMIFEWEFSPDSINWTRTSTADTLPTYTTTINQLRYFRCKVTCNSTGFFEYTIPVKISVTAVGSITGRTGGSVCTDGTVALSASASAGTILWYADSTAGFPLRTSGALPGNNYTTPFINTTTTYYVSSVVNGGNFSGGRTTASIPTNGTSSQLGIGFTVSSTIRLNSVKIYAQGSTSPVSISLFSGTSTSGTPLYTTVQYIPSAGWNTVTLNWVIAPGNYTLARSTTVGGLLYRHLSTAPNAFPYAIGGRLVLNGGVAGNSVNTDYNYFYDWIITGLCESPRLPVVATVSDAPAVSVLGNDPICAGAPISLNASSTNSNYNYSWIDNNGTLLSSGPRYSTGPLSDTITLRLAGVDATAGSPFNGCRDTLTFDVIVNPVPSTVTVTPSTATVCSSPVSTRLTASGGLIDGVQQTMAWSPATNLFLDSLRTTPYVAGSNALVVWAAPISNVTYSATAGTTCQRTGTAALAVVPYGPLSVNVNSNASGDSICAGSSITFTAIPPTGLPSPTYKWQRKAPAGSWTDIGTFGTTATYAPTSPVDGDSIRVVLKSTSTCNPSGVDTVRSAGRRITVKPIPTVSITGSASVCIGSSNNQYTATISPVGPTTYAWSIAPSNAATVSGANTATFTINNPTNPFTVNLAATIRGCTGNATGLGVGANSATSNSVVASSSTPGPICAGTSVTFTATPTNGGTNTWYRWQVSSDGGANYSNLGSVTDTTASFTTNSLPAGNLLIRVRMRSKLTCPAPDTANSSPITFVVNPIPSGSTITGPTAVCQGSVNNPYTINILPAGATSSSQSWSVTSNGQISGSITGTTVNINATGSAGTDFTVSANVVRNGCSTVISTPVIPINPSVTSGVSISGYTPGSSICPNVPNPLTAVPTPGNLPSPVYQWQLSTNGGANWSNVATGNTYSPATALANDGDSIRVILASSGNSCASTPDTAGVTLSISSGGTASVSLANDTACTGQNVIFTATALNASSPVYKFYLNNVLQQSGSSNTYEVSSASVLNNPVRCDVEYQACAGGQSTISSNIVTISTLQTTPNVSILGCSSIITANQTVTLSATGGLQSYQWIRNGSDISGEINASLSTGLPANYSVRATATNGCVVTSPAQTLADLRTSPLPIGTYSIPGTGCNSFPDLATVITRLNTYGIDGSVSGRVVFNIAGTHTEIAPAGGFALTATGTAANPIIFQKSGAGSPVFTASNSNTAGSLTDAVIKLIGSDYISIKGLTLRENNSNTTTAVATNNMTEFGVALLRASATNGAQNDSLVDNIISLNRNYANSFGIYANSNHSATDVISNSAPTSSAGANSNVRIYGNSISNVNFGIVMVGDNSTGRNYDNNVDIGGTSAAAGNTITNWGGQVVASNFVSVPSTTPTPTNTYAIYSANQVNGNISNNQISGTISGTAINVRGIWKNFSNSPTNSFADSITANTIGLTLNFTPGSAGYAVDGIRTEGITSLVSGASLSINNNILQNWSVAAGSATTGSPATIMINTGSSVTLPATLNINGNQIKGYASLATGGSFVGISLATSANAMSQLNINNNVIGGIATTDSIKLDAGALSGIVNNNATAIINKSVNGNSVRGLRTATSNIIGLNISGATTLCSISNNTVEGLRNLGTGFVDGIDVTGLTAGGTIQTNNNQISGITTNTGAINGLYLRTGTSTILIRNNTLSNYTLLNGAANSIFGLNSTISANIDSNTFSNYSFNNAAGTGSVYGVYQSTAGTITVTANTFSGFNSAAGGTSVVSAVYNLNSVSSLIDKNRIFNLSNSNSSNQQLVSGIDIRGGATVNVINNFISDLRMPVGTNPDGVRGISSTATTTSTSNIYYNTIYLNASSTGATFGSSGIYHSASATASTGQLTLRNNIISNESTPSGAAWTVAFRRNGADLTNFTTGSNNNLLFTGTGANRYLYTNTSSLLTTIDAYRTAMGGTRESSAFSTKPYFVNASSTPFDLHLRTNLNCASDRKGNNAVILVPDDIDNNTRNTSTDLITSVGADEYNTSGFGEGVWAGVSSDWNNPENWCGSVPTSSTNVTIRQGASNYPIINGSGAAPVFANITLETGSTVTIEGNGSVTSHGIWTNNGRIIGNGSINFVGTGNQSFPGGTGTVDPIGTLVLNKTSGITTIDRSITIKGALEPLAGNLTLSQDIVLSSTADSTARLGKLGATAAFTYSGGAFVVERYIPSGRKWRFLSTPINTDTASVKHSWQRGTLVTSNLANWSTFGFDALSPGGPGMKYFNTDSQAYIGISRTDTAIRRNSGYMLFVRGDRASTSTVSNPTTLRLRGPVFTGTLPAISIPASPSATDVKWASVGNPYPSAVNFGQLNRSASLKDGFYVWDPKRLVGFNLGGWVYCEGFNGNYEPNLSSPSYPDVNANIQIQSGQAIVVQANAGAGTATLAFNENAKVSGSREVFRPYPNQINQMLFGQLRSAGTDGSYNVHDGFRIRFDDRFNNGVDYDDVPKLMNSFDNFAVNNRKVILAVERRKSIRNADTIFLDINRLRPIAYNLQFETRFLDRNGVEGWLVDRFTGVRTALNMNGLTQYNFMVVPGNVEAAAANRFYLVFRKSSVPVRREDPSILLSANPVEQSGITLKWKANIEKNVSLFEILYGTAEADLEVIAELDAATLASVNGSYFWLHENANPGKAAIYKVRAVTVPGEGLLSNLAKVSVSEESGKVVVSPNPVQDNMIRLRFSDLPSGKYSLQVINAAGQLVHATTLSNPGGEWLAELPAGRLATGKYVVKLKGPGKLLRTAEAIVE